MRAVLVILALTPGLTLAHPAPRARDLRKAQQVSILLFGDSGTGLTPQYEVARGMRAACQSAGCDFAVGLGDNIYPSGVTSAADPSFFSHFERPYEPFGRFNFWMILGNHDHRGSFQAQIDYTQLSSRWKMPARQYKIPSLPDWLHIYTLDTSTIDAARAAAAELALCDQPGWRILVGHHPLYSNGMHGGEESTRKRVLPVIEKCTVQTYFAGHDHHQEHISSARTDYVVQGAASKIRDVQTVNYDPATGLKQKFAKSILGFAIGRWTKTTQSLSFYDQQGTMIYTTRSKVQRRVSP